MKPSRQRSISFLEPIDIETGSSADYSRPSSVENLSNKTKGIEISLSIQGTYIGKKI